MKTREDFEAEEMRIRNARERTDDPRMRAQLNKEARVNTENRTSWERGVLRTTVINAIETLRLNGAKEAVREALEDALAKVEH